ncbi:MAG: tetratricopeptide (TPR) repeat protein [Verrucomicrobiales bacterium]|jgi:tetratricopeptide (TPR) repeat protein
MMRQGRAFSGHERNCCFLNTLANPDSARFANISAASGLDFEDDGRAIVEVDWDHDGDLDLWISNRNAPRLRLMRNDSKSSNHFLALRLVGSDKTTNQDAVGARVEVITLNPKLEARPPPDGTPRPEHHAIKTLRAGEGFLAQSSKWLHFGLGAADEIERVVVHWPGGAAENFTGLQTNRRYRLVQGSGKAVESDRSRNELAIRPSNLEIPPESATARIPLVTLFTLPRMDYLGLDGSQQALPLGRGQHVLINLWSASCRPCLTELKEFGEREAEIRAAGVEIVALSVDQLIDNPASMPAASALAASLPIRFPAGFASPQLMNLLQMFHDQIIPLQRPLPLPSSFLLDPDGRVHVIYKGTLSVDQLLADVQHTAARPPERQARAALLPGLLLESEILSRSFRTEQSHKLFKMAQELRRLGMVRDEIAHYEASLKISPENAEAHYNLGNAQAGQGRAAEAIVHYQAALLINPDLAEAHNNWGNALKALGRAAESVAHFQEALRIKPDWAEAHLSWGNALAILGNAEEAVAHYQAALLTKPKLAEAHHNLGTVLKALGREQEAQTHQREAQRIMDGRSTP